MAKTRLSGAQYVERGYGQVEPNHLSAQRTGQIYAQLPANADIAVLENGQFVKYDYATGEVNFTGAGEWMLVYNEVKVYREGQSDADFAMIKDNYVARVYSPIDGDAAKMQQITDKRYYGGLDSEGNPIRKVVTAADPYEVDSTADPFGASYDYGGPKKMYDANDAVLSMVPRVFKTMVGDIYTTNCLKLAVSGDTVTSPTIGQTFTPGADGYLAATTATTGMLWQVVKIYDLGDRQPAVKLMRIQ